MIRQRRVGEILGLANTQPIGVGELISASQVNVSEVLTSRSEEFFRLLIEDIQDCAIFVLRPDGCVASWNRGAEALFGYTEAEILGTYFSIFSASEDIESEMALSRLHQASTEGRAEHEGWHVRRDRTRFWGSSVVTAMRDEHGLLYGFSKVVRNITERRETAERLRQSEERLRLMVEGMKDYAIFMLDPKGRIIDWNSGTNGYQRYWGEELIGQNFSCFYQAEDLERGLPQQQLAAALFENRFEGEGWRVRKDGSRFWASIIITILRDDVGGLRGFSQVMRDTSERRAAEEQLLRNAFYDPLTGLPNRALFKDRLKFAIERARRPDHQLFAVLFLDLDGFKFINDSFGHMLGDELLVAISRRLESSLRPGDTVARFGGDEFTILLENIREASETSRIAERIQKDLMKPFSIGGHEIWTSASIGIALSTTSYNHPEETLCDADAAMYRAKGRGRARYEVFERGMQAGAKLLHLDVNLRRAIEREEFCLRYQPIFTLAGNRLCGFEALVRWQHPEHGLIYPEQFIALAEETKLIIPIGEWVLREACRQMQEWQQRFPGCSALRMSVNLSRKQFMQPDLVEQLTRTLHATELDPGSLTLDITESLMLESTELVAETLTRLRTLGVELNLDGFGTGYSSLSCLHRFPVSRLKLDRSFVSSMASDGIPIVETIIMLARNLGIEVIAVGIETEDQLMQLRALDCHYGQGFLFSKPVNGEAATLMIADEQKELTVNY